MNLLDLMVKIGVDDQASGKISGMAANIRSGIGTAAKYGAAAVGVTTVAVAGMTKEFIGSAQEVAEYGDHIDKMSQKLGISAEAYQEWDAILAHSGTSIDSMKAGMRSLSNAVAKNDEAFAKLGFTQEQLASMSQEELFAESVTALQNVTDESERAQLAQALFGRSAMELGPLLNTSAEDTEAMRQRVHELGGVLSDDAVKAAARFQDSLQDMQTAFRGIKMQLMSEFLPGMATVMDGMGNIFSGHVDEGSEQLKQGFGEIASVLLEKAPEAMAAGGKLLLSIGEGIVKVLPSVGIAVAEGVASIITSFAEAFNSGVKALVSGDEGSGLSEAGQSIVSSLGQALYEAAPLLLEGLGMLIEYIAVKAFEMLPQIVDAFMGLIDLLATAFLENGPSMLESAGAFFLNVLQAIVDNLPEIVQGLVDGILKLLDTVIEHGPEMLVAASEFILNVLTAIINNLPAILAALVNGVGRLISGVAERTPDMLAAGAKLLSGLLSAVVNALPELLSGLGNLLSRGVDIVFSFNRDMMTAGANLVQGLIDGIAYNFGAVVDTVLGGLQNVVDSALAFLGIASPSRLFAWMGDMTMEGMAEGIEDTAAKAERAMRNAAEGIYGAASGTVNVSPFSTAARNTPLFTISIGELAVREEADVDRIAERLSLRINRQMGGGLWSASY